MTFTKDKKEARERTDVGSVACHPVHTVSPVAALLIHCDIVACIIAELDRELAPDSKRQATIQVEGSSERP